MSGKVPLLLIFFRRPSALQVTEAIRSYMPDNVFLVADGGRNPREHAECEEIRRRVEEAIDWPCEVNKLYSEKNLGCRENIPRGISWVFSQVDRAIILEDDTVPAPSFFPFCGEMLERYADDERIMTISGTNFFPGHSFFGPYSYAFSGYAETWGYATWARAWRHYDADMGLWPEARDGGMLRSGFLAPREQVFWQAKFESTWSGTGQNDPYDYQWVFACWLRGALSVVPRANLVSNIGDGPLATHTQKVTKPLFNRELGNVGFPLAHPPEAVRNTLLDDAYGRFVFYGDPPGPVRRLRNRIAGFLPPRLRRSLRAALAKIHQPINLEDT